MRSKHSHMLNDNDILVLESAWGGNGWPRGPRGGAQAESILPVDSAAELGLRHPSGEKASSHHTAKRETFSETEVKEALLLRAGALFKLSSPGVGRNVFALGSFGQRSR